MTRQEKSFHLFAPVHVHSLADKAARECVGAVFLHWAILALVTERIIADLPRSPPDELGHLAVHDELQGSLRIVVSQRLQNVPVEEGKVVIGCVFGV